MAGTCQSKLLRGFSIEKSPPLVKTAKHASTDLATNKFPKNTRAAFSAESELRPSGWAAERRGGGPPSALRAAENVLHGVPQWTKRTAPAQINSMTNDHRASSTTSNGVGTSEQIVTSIGGKVGTPQARMALVRLAVPEKISKKKGPAAHT